MPPNDPSQQFMQNYAPNLLAMMQTNPMAQAGKDLGTGIQQAVQNYVNPLKKFGLPGQRPPGTPPVGPTPLPSAMPAAPPPPAQMPPGGAGMAGPMPPGMTGVRPQTGPMIPPGYNPNAPGFY